MKSEIQWNHEEAKAVAPYAGAWIEIARPVCCTSPVSVAPYAGAWIEIYKVKRLEDMTIVAPYAGAWIEIPTLNTCGGGGHGRSLRGSVD